jgi:pimeloyl-ACP methyl ester carboxylesterase
METKLGDKESIASELKLVLLPGMDGTGQLFSDFIEVLPKTLETVTVRYQTNRCLSYSELENFVREACSISGPFILLAESFSTPLAIQYAASNPVNLVGLVLCAGFATSPVIGWRQLLGRLLGPLLFRIPLPNLAAKFWLVGPDAPPSLLVKVRAVVSSVLPIVLASRLRAVLGCNVRAELGQVAVPILYIQASQDRLVRASCLEEIRQIKPQIAVTVLDGPHLLLQREPRKAAEIIANFATSGVLRRVARVPGGSKFSH